MHQQRPDQDISVSRMLDKSIAELGRHLKGHDDGPAGTALGGDHRLPLYQPVRAILWGPLDSATFFLADQLEVVQSLAASDQGLAEAREYAFGPLFELPDGFPDQGWKAVSALFGTGDCLPLIAIARLKIGDHLLALWGTHLRKELFRRIQGHLTEEAEDGTATIRAVLLRSWSWTELTVVVLSSDPAKLADGVKWVEGLELRQVREGDGRERLPAPTNGPGLAIAEAWTGRTSADLESSEVLLDRKNVFVDVQVQLGVLGKPLLTTGMPDEAPDCPLQDPDSAPSRLLRAGFGMARADDTLPSLAELQEALASWASRSWSERPEPERSFCALIQCLPRPGHHEGFLQKVDPLVRLLGLERHQGQSRALGGRGLVWTLRIRLRDTLNEFLFLLTLTLVWRLVAELTEELEDVSTLIGDELPVPPTTAPALRVAAWGANTNSGYARLLSSAEAINVDRFRQDLDALRVAPIDSAYIVDWIRAVQGAAARPAMFGAMMDQEAMVRALRRVLTERVAQQQGSEETSRNRLVHDLRELARHGQWAFVQAILHSPDFSSTPPVRVEVPFGISQLCSLVGGVAAVAFSLAGRRGGRVTSRDEAVLVVFSGDSGVVVKPILGIPVLRLALWTALNPFCLPLLFHELGHVLEHRTLTTQQLDTLEQGTESSVGHFYVSFIKSKGDGPDPDLLREALRMLDEVLPDLVWRRLGCGDLDAWRDQFMLASAMGLREQYDPLAAARVTYWGVKSIIRVVLQTALAQAEDSLVESRGAGGQPLLSLAAREFGSFVEERDGVFNWRRDTASPIFRQCAEFVAQSSSDAKAIRDRHETRDAYLDQVAEGFMLLTEARLLQILAPWMRWIGGLHGMLAGPAIEPTAAMVHESDGIRDAFDLVEARVRKLQVLLREAVHPDTEKLARLRVGQAVEARCLLPEAPWKLLQTSEEGWPFEPSPGAFVWLRTLLGVATDRFLANLRADAAHAGRFDLCIPADAELGSSPEHRGVYLSHLTSTEVAGGDERDRNLRLRVAVLHSLGELAGRMRSARLARFLHPEGRREDSRRVPESQQVSVALSNPSADLEAALGQVVDRSTYGCGLLVGEGPLAEEIVRLHGSSRRAAGPPVLLDLGKTAQDTATDRWSVAWALRLPGDGEVRVGLRRVDATAVSATERRGD